MTKPQAHNTDLSAGRISFPTVDTMNPAQREVYDAIVSGPRGRLVGPLRAALHNPTLADRWQKLGKVLRFETSLPSQLSELSILITARRWNCKLEWAIHAKDAKRAELDTATIEAIRVCEAPNFAKNMAAWEVYEFTRQLTHFGDINADVYQAVVDRWDEVGAVELTAVVGYYSMVAMTLNAHAIPLPDEDASDLPVMSSGLTELPVALRPSN